jgi:hypothetical protein
MQRLGFFAMILMAGLGAVSSFPTTSMSGVGTSSLATAPTNFVYHVRGPADTAGSWEITDFAASYPQQTLVNSASLSPSKTLVQLTSAAAVPPQKQTGVAHYSNPLMLVESANNAATSKVSFSISAAFSVEFPSSSLKLMRSSPEGFSLFLHNDPRGKNASGGLEGGTGLGYSFDTTPVPTYSFPSYVPLIPGTNQPQSFPNISRSIAIGVTLAPNRAHLRLGIDGVWKDAAAVDLSANTPNLYRDGIYYLNIGYDEPKKQLDVSLMVRYVGDYTFARYKAHWTLPSSVVDILGGSPTAWVGVGATSTSLTGTPNVANVSLASFIFSSVSAPAPAPTSPSSTNNNSYPLSLAADPANRLRPLPPALLVLRFDDGGSKGDVDADELDCLLCNRVRQAMDSSTLLAYIQRIDLGLFSSYSTDADRFCALGSATEPGQGALSFAPLTAGMAEQRVYQLVANASILPLPSGADGRSVCVWFAFPQTFGPLLFTADGMALFAYGDRFVDGGYFALLLNVTRATNLETEPSAITILLGGGSRVEANVTGFISPYFGRATPYSGALRPYYHVCAVYGDASIVLNGTASTSTNQQVKAFRIYINGAPIPDERLKVVAAPGSPVMKAAVPGPQLNTSATLSQWTDIFGSQPFEKQVLRIGGNILTQYDDRAMASPFQGVIDEITVYDVALTAEQVLIQRESVRGIFTMQDKVYSPDKLETLFPSVDRDALARQPIDAGDLTAASQLIIYASFTGDNFTDLVYPRPGLELTQSPNSLALQVIDRFGRQKQGVSFSNVGTPLFFDTPIINSSTSVVRVPTATAPRTVAFWLARMPGIQVSLLPTHLCVFSYGGTSAEVGEAFAVSIVRRGTAGPLLRVEFAGIYIETAPMPNNVDLFDGRWHMIAVSLNRQNYFVNVYVDGRRVPPYTAAPFASATNTVFDFLLINTNDKSPLRIGSSVLGDEYYLGGMMLDDFQLFATALDDALVYALYLKMTLPPVLRTNVATNLLFSYELASRDKSVFVPSLVSSLSSAVLDARVNGAGGWSFLAFNTTGKATDYGRASVALLFDANKQAFRLPGTALAIATGAVVARTGNTSTSLARAFRMRSDLQIMQNNEAPQLIPDHLTTITPSVYPQNYLLPTDVVLIPAVKANGSFPAVSYRIPQGSPNITWVKAEVVLLDALLSSRLSLVVDSAFTQPLSMNLSESSARDFSTRRVFWFDLQAVGLVATKSLLFSVSINDSPLSASVPTSGPRPLDGAEADQDTSIYAGLGSGAVALNIELYGSVIKGYCPQGFALDSRTPGAKSYCYKTLDADALRNIPSTTKADFGLPVNPPTDFNTFVEACRASNTPQSGLATWRNAGEYDYVATQRCGASTDVEMYVGVHDLAVAEDVYVFTSGANIRSLVSPYVLGWGGGEPTRSTLQNCVSAIPGASGLQDVQCTRNVTTTTACCEAPLLPLNACPDGFGAGNVPAPDGYCYTSLPQRPTGAGYKWQEAVVVALPLLKTLSRQLGPRQHGIRPLSTVFLLKGAEALLAEIPLLVAPQ